MAHLVFALGYVATRTHSRILNGQDCRKGFSIPTKTSEVAIKQAMCTDAGITTGFCAAPTLTRYVWEMLGNPIPAEIYDTIFADGFQ